MITIERHVFDLQIPSLRFISVVSALRNYLLYDDMQEEPPNLDTIRNDLFQKDIPELTQSLIWLLRSLPSIHKYESLLKSLEFVRSLPPTRKNLVTMQQYEELCEKVYHQQPDLELLLIHAVNIDEKLRNKALDRLVCMLPSDIPSVLSFILRLPWSAIARHSWLSLGTWLLFYAVRRNHSESVLDVLQDLLVVNHTLCEK